MSDTEKKVDDLPPPKPSYLCPISYVEDEEEGEVVEHEDAELDTDELLDEEEDEEEEDDFDDLDDEDDEDDDDDDFFDDEFDDDFGDDDDDEFDDDELDDLDL